MAHGDLPTLTGSEAKSVALVNRWVLPRRRGRVCGSIAIFLVSLRSRVDSRVESKGWSAIWAGRRPRAVLKTQFLDSATPIYVKTVLLIFRYPGGPPALDRGSCRCQRQAVGAVDISARPSKVQICRCQPHHAICICPYGESACLRRLGSIGAQKLLESSLLVRCWMWLLWGKTAVCRVMGDRGTVLHEGRNVFVIDLHAHEEHGGVSLGW